MRLHEFLEQVQQRAHLNNTGEALRACQATLRTLGERLSGNEPERLAAQLPPELAEFLQPDNPIDTPGRFSSDEFLRRVSEHEGIPASDAIHHAQAVIDILREAASPDEIDAIRRQLPDDYARLFDPGNSGRMPVS